MKAKEKQNQVLTNDLRETIKTIMQKEIEKLPEYLATLDTKERLNVICKLMPFVLPKIETVHPNTGEPFGAFF